MTLNGMTGQTPRDVAARRTEIEDFVDDAACGTAPAHRFGMGWGGRVPDAVE
jgi:hypothetical protein